MYQLPESVRRRLLRRYRKRSREVAIDDRFRGWAWEVPPIDPPYDYELPLSELVSRYCESMRDIYLRYIERKTRPITMKMIEGGLYHAAVAAVVLEAKRELYSSAKPVAAELGVHLTSIRDRVVDDLIRRRKGTTTEGTSENSYFLRIRSNMSWLWDFEVNHIVAAVDAIQSLQPYIGVDALVNSAIPVVVEQKLDGRNIGLSGQLSADAFGSEGVVLDIKTGERRHFHRLSTAGYAMVIESIYEYPIDVGCIVYCWFRKPKPPTIEYDLHQIDEPLRQEFLELRDTAMKLIFDQRDPGLPSICYADCPYWNECH
jgi:CRISPR-associated protein Csa1